MLSEPKLSARQRALLARLETLAARAHKQTLPVEVLEIIGYGSFFRGKSSPKDVDLIFRCTRGLCPGFAKFRELLRHICSDVQYQHDFERPSDAIASEHESRHCDTSADRAPLAEEKALFAKWLEPYSWSMLFPKTFRDTPSWEDPFGFTRRLLRRELPNLNVSHYLYPGTTPAQMGLRAGVTEVIWSRDEPDIRRNVLRSLEPERLTEKARLELENFNRQLFLLEATRIVLESNVRCHLGQDTRVFSEACLRELQLHNALLNEQEVEAELGLHRPSDEDGVLSHSDALRLVEERRHQIEQLWNEVEAVREIGCLLDWRASGNGDIAKPTGVFITEELLSGKSPKQQHCLRAILAEFRLLDS